MKTMPKILIVAVLAVAIAGVLYVKQERDGSHSGDDAHIAEAAEVTGRTDEATPRGGSPDQKVASADETAAPDTEGKASKQLPRLVDLGADKCIPCKMMAPILEELKKELAGTIDVEFIDVWKNEQAGQAYGIQIIPTQIFFDADGKERFRHTGFFSKEDILAKWKELGVDVGAAEKAKPAFARWEPAQPDARPTNTVCYLCDGDIDPKTKVAMGTSAGDVLFCSPHCYIIAYASLTDESKSHDDARVADWDTGSLVPVTKAAYLYGVDENGRPTIRAFEGKSAAKDSQKQAGGNVLAWAAVHEKETATLCGFCDRPVYPEDASPVRVDGLQTRGCCPMCALGVAARTQRNIETVVKDALSGDPIRVKTFEGHVGELEPRTAVAWAGAKKSDDGKISSTGCFKQAFFVDEDNLKKWVEAHPTATGQMVTVEQALAKKMSMSQDQISKACKIGECTPK